MSRDVVMPSDLSLFLTIMANGPATWTTDQVIQAFVYAKGLIPKSFEADVLDFSVHTSKLSLDKH